MFPTTPNHTMSQFFFTMMSPFKNHIYILQVQHLMLFFWKFFLGTTSSLVCDLVHKHPTGLSPPNYNYSK